MRFIRILMIWAAVIAAVATIVTVGHYEKSSAGKPSASAAPKPIALPSAPGTYLGVYAAGVPGSYAGIAAFTTATGVRPGVVSYYSGWLEPFRASFAATVAASGAVPLVQLEPTNVSLAAIATGRYDSYLSSYADAVRAFRRPVILSFCHEMNGSWYSWGYKHTPASVFVAAWRHIVTVFRAVGAVNVTWLWTVNIVNDTQRGRIPSPASWWPGGSYVTWVGIDGYYVKPSWRFVPLFGPTIVAVRALTSDPILIAETAAASTARQPAKIADLFAGIRVYGLLGLVWFDATGSKDWRLSGRAAIAAFRRGARTYRRG